MHSQHGHHKLSTWSSYLLKSLTTQKKQKELEACSSLLPFLFRSITDQSCALHIIIIIMTGNVHCVQILIHVNKVQILIHANKVHVNKVENSLTH